MINKSLAVLLLSAATLAGASLQNAPKDIPGSCPIGSVLPFASETNQIPDGWLLCDGSAVKKDKYNILYRTIGMKHGSGKPRYGEPNGDFNVPDYRGRFLRGVDDPDGPGSKDAAGRDPDAKRRLHMVTEEEVGGLVGSVQHPATGSPVNKFKIAEDPGHSHKFSGSKGNGTGYGGFPGSGDGQGSKVHGRTDENGKHSHKLTGGDKETRPANAYVNWMIRAK